MANIDVAINLIARDLTGNSLFGIGQVLDMVAQSMLGTGASAQQLATTTVQLGVAAGTAAVLWKGFSTTLDDAWASAADLQTELVQVGIATQTNADALPVLTQAINDLGIKTVYSSTQAGQAFERMSEQGFTVSQVLYGLNAPVDEYKQHAYDATEATMGLGYQALVLGQALGADATQGATLLGAALHTFASEGLSAAQVANLLAGAYFNGIPSATALQQAIQMGGAQAATAGIKMQDYLTTLDLLTQAGMSASSAGSSLNYMIQAMISPTATQARMMSDLGIMTAQEASPAFRTFTQDLIANGGATQGSIEKWSNSVTGLQDMFTAAQGVGMIPLDENFNQWALKAGFLSNNLFDANGNFIGLKAGIDTLDKAMSGMTVEEKMNALAGLFNIRSGRAARILTDLQGFDTQYEGIWTKMGNANVTDAAQRQLDTMAGSWNAFKDSLGSALAMAVMPMLPAVTNLVNGLNNLLEAFMNAPEGVRAAVGIFLVVGTVLSGLTLAIIAVVGVFSLLSLVGVTVGAVLTAVGIPLAIIVGGALLVAGGFLLMKTHGQELLNVLGPILSFLGKLKDTIGGAFQSTLKDMAGLFDGMGQALSKSLKDAGDSFGHLGQVFQQYSPQLRLVGQIILGVLVVAIGILVGVITGLVSAAVPVLQGLGMVFSGLAMVISGVIQNVVAIIGGFIQIFQDIFTGRFDRILSDVQKMWSAVWQSAADFFGGIVTIIFGLLSGLVGGVIGFIGGLVDGVIKFFQHLFDVLVGHSIIPDLVNSILSWIGQLPGKVVSLFSNLVSGAVNEASKLPGQIMGALASLPGQLLSFGGQIMSSLASGISGGLNNVMGQISNAGSHIIGGLKNIVNNIPGIGGIASHLGFASGGTVPATGLYMVGEQGPELMALPGGAHIYNNPDSMRLMDGLNGAGYLPVSSGYGSGSGTIHLQVYLGNDTLIDSVLDDVGGQLRVLGMNRMGR